MIRTRSISNTLQRQIATLPEGEVFTYSLMPEGSSELAFAQTLSRMVRAGKLVRMEKGKFYKPKNTRFGALRPSEAEIIKTLTRQGSKTIGYLTGNSLYNRWGLTTQVASVLTIARKTRLPLKEISGYKVKFVIQPLVFTKREIPLLQLLDVFTDIRKIPDTSPAKVIPILIDKIRTLEQSQISRMSKLAIAYPPSTRALVGAILENYFPAQPIDDLRKSLNPLTTYKLEGVEQVLSNKAKWNFI